MLGFLAYFVFIIILTFVIALFVVLIHEIGHAIPMYIFSKRKVTIFLGSHGDTEGSLHFNLGKFSFYISKKNWYFPIGQCVGKNQKFSPLQHIIVFGMGPLLPMLLALPTSILIFFNDWPGLLKLASFLFLVIATITLYYNLAKNVSALRNRNDGYWIKQYSKLLFKDKDYQKKYSRLASLIGTDGEVHFLDHYDAYVVKGFKNTEMLEYAAQIAFSSKNNEKAIDYFIQLEKIKQPTAQEYALRAYAELYIGNTTLAKEYCAKSLKVNPHYISALQLQLEWFLEDGNRDKTDKLLKRVETIKNKGIYEYYFAGRIYQNYGEIQKAIDALEKVFDVDKTNNGVKIYLGIAYAQNGNKEKALAFYDGFKEIESPNINDYINHSLILLEIKDYVEGLKLLLKALEIDHTSVIALNNIADALNRMERYQDAIDYADKGIDISKEKFYLYTNKAFAQLMLGQVEEGKATNDAGLDLNPNSSNAHRNLGIYYTLTGDNQLATEYLQKAYDLDKTTFMVVSLLYDLTGKLPY